MKCLLIELTRSTQDSEVESLVAEVTFLVAICAVGDMAIG